MHVYIVINRVKKTLRISGTKNTVCSSLCSTELACVRPVIAGCVGSSVFIFKGGVVAAAAELRRGPAMAAEVGSR